MLPAIKIAIQNFYSQHKTSVDALAMYLDVPGLWLVCLFYNESGLNPSIKNSIGAAGLNQMLPSTLAGLGITTDQYINGGVDYQLQVMKTFFTPIAGRVKRAGDLYLYNFWPDAVISNYPADFVIGKQGDYTVIKGLTKNVIYTSNRSLDFNNDGEITRQDFWDGFENKYDELVTVSGGFFFRDLIIDLKTHWLSWLIVIVIVVAIIIYISNV